MTYTEMASDVLHFIRKYSLSNVSLLGHSMYDAALTLDRVAQLNIVLDTGGVK